VAVLVVQGAFRNWNWMIKNTYRHCTRCEAGVSWVQARSAFRQIPDYPSILPRLHLTKCISGGCRHIDR